MNWLRQWKARRGNRDALCIIQYGGGGVVFEGMLKQDGRMFIDCPKCFEQDGYVGSSVHPRKFAALLPGAKRYGGSPDADTSYGPPDDIVFHALWCSEGHEWVMSVWRKSLQSRRELAFLNIFKLGGGWVA